LSNSVSQDATGRFPKSSRLLRHADFEKVYKRGRRHFAQHMTVFYLGAEKADHGLRVGFTVSKALGGAVQRNRMKRRLREAVRLKGLPHVVADVVINPKRTLLDAEFADLQNDVARAFEAIAKNLNKERARS